MAKIDQVPYRLAGNAHVIKELGLMLRRELRNGLFSVQALPPLAALPQSGYNLQTSPKPKNPKH